MTAAEQQEIIEQFFEKRMKVLSEKGSDYNNEDVLGIFKLMGAIEKRAPSQVILSEIIKKTLRLQNLFSTNRKPNNESIEDNLLDIANYTDLLICALHYLNKQVDNTNNLP